MAAVHSSSHSLPKLKTNRIPVVQHLIKDSEIEQADGQSLKALDLDRIVKLFIDPHSVNLIDRHLHAVKKVCKHYNLGFVSESSYRGLPQIDFLFK